MNTKTLAALGAVLALSAVYTLADHFGTAFTYQGQLASGGQAANGLYDLQFKLYNSLAGGTGQVGGTLTSNAVPVANGLFVVALDFGDGIFTGPPRWLEIAVRTNGAVTFVTLSPRQQLTPLPYALYTPNADVAVTATTANSVANNAVTAPGIAADNVVKSVNALKDDVILAPGANLTLTPSGQTLTLASPTDWHIGGNASTTPGVNFLGTTDNQPLELHINGTRALRLEPNTYAENNTIGGASVNTVYAGAVGSTISGGGSGNRGGNYISTDFSTIGGGFGNSIATNAGNSTIGGGASNLILSNAFQSTIAGGFYQHIREDAFDSTIGGGFQNEIQQKASAATIAGGSLSTIQSNANTSTIGGGGGNQIQTNASNSTIAGGVGNVIQHDSFSGAIGGGQLNQILPFVGAAVISGGSANTNGGSYATVPGGQNNLAGGAYSFAAGQRAKAAHQGAFVWADSQAADFSSTANNQFLIRAGGNVGINKNNPATALDVNGTVSAAGFVGGVANLGALAAAQLQIGTNVLVTGPFSTVAGGQYNTNSGFMSTIGGGYQNTMQPGSESSWIGAGEGNNNGGYASAIGAGMDNLIGPSADASAILAGAGNTIQALAYAAVIGGGTGNTVGTNSESATIGGGRENAIQTGADDSFIGGGWDCVIQSGAEFSVIGGGRNNTIETNAYNAFIGGGWINTIESNAYYSNIGGGRANTIGVNSANSTIAGGLFNIILDNAWGSSLGGGVSNTNGAPSSVVPGGDSNLAGGANSFAAGHRAKAPYQGDFVWADSQDADFAATAPNQFLIRAGGNVGINKNNPATVLDVNGTVTATGFSGPGAGLTGIPTTGLADGSVTTAKLADGAVNSAKIADNSVGSADLASDVASLGKVTAGTMSAGGTSISFGVDAYLWDHDIFLRGDTFHGIGWYGSPKYFGSSSPNGPVLYGFNGGGLGTKHTSLGTNLVLAWSNTGVTVDPEGRNTNGLTWGLTFGASGSGSGEGISSKRTTGANQYGLDFYTVYTRRMTVDNSGNLLVQGIVDTIANNSLTLRANGTPVLRLDATSLYPSIAMGACTDSGMASVALGLLTQATNSYGTAVGAYSVAGGIASFAAGMYATATGLESAAIGQSVQASGDYSTALNWNTKALGNYSFAGGYFATAQRPGSFVWADSTPVAFDPFALSGPQGVNNTFNVRSTGGFYIATGVNTTSGAITSGMYLSGGGSGWNTLSDRAAKTNFETLDDREILDRLVSMPIKGWNYKTQDPSIRHIGPMAQDFNQAFGVGETDEKGEKRYINSVDVDGVALAAIQGLNHKVESENASLRSELKARNDEVQALKQRLDAIERMLEHAAK